MRFARSHVLERVAPPRCPNIAYVPPFWFDGLTMPSAPSVLSMVSRSALLPSHLRNLQQNALITLPEGVFEGLPALESL